MPFALFHLFWNLWFQELVHDYSFIPNDYGEVVTQWGDPDFYEKNVTRIQLPYLAAATVSAFTIDQQKERRKELAKRLVEINARKRDERVILLSTSVLSLSSCLYLSISDFVFLPLFDIIVGRR